MARAAIALDEVSPTAWQFLGSSLFKSGEFGGALEALEKAVELNANESLLLHLVAECHERLGNRERAKEFHSRAVALTGRTPPI